MKQRALIKSQIIQAWNESIESDYCNQRINSERSLQASFWSRLNCILSKNRRLFIEPTITITTDSGIKKLTPDIVVCNTKEVIAVIELKYSPRAQPKFQKDIESLCSIARNREQIIISNERFLGIEKDGNKYALSNNVLLVWAGVHAKEMPEANELYSSTHKILNDCYLQLHAVTEKNSAPTVLQKQ
jgi:hypothetical protein